jgi:3,4-dihydroxy 2-butanone 4-phosphate synthase/GTP cyclohydrolase II
MMLHGRGAALKGDPFDSPARGESRSLGSIDVQLRMGDFKAHAFETGVQGCHIIALSQGDVTSADPLLVRFHSECITSESLGGCDCDCVEQLHAALRSIAEEGRGVVFYLRQEGRGAGYHAKARDRMGVAATDNALNTFEMYEAIGLAGDPRDYTAIGDCAFLMGITAPIRLMTNNPSKLASLRDMGLNPHSHVPIEVPPNPFNTAYLSAKRDHGGHMLSNGNGAELSEFPWPVTVFKPYSISEAMRFSHEASYPLPVRALNGEYLLERSAVDELKGILLATGSTLRVLNSRQLSADRVRVQLDPEQLRKIALQPSGSAVAEFLRRHASWFEAHVYHDTFSRLDHVVLEFGQRGATRDITPLVRIQPESILRRFPLKERSSIYEESLRLIMERGRGFVVVYPEDGRGHGVAAVFKEQQLLQSGLVKSPAEAAEVLGIKGENRDYLPIGRLIRRHCSGGAVQFILREASQHAAHYVELVADLHRRGTEVREPLVVPSN